MGKWAVRCLAFAAWCWLAALPSAGGAEVGATDETRWSDLAPLPIHAPFVNVRYPHLDARGNVLFIADDGPKGKAHGIYRYAADSALVCLVRAGETTVPGGEATLGGIASLQVDENTVDFVFHAADSDDRHGLYHWSGGRLDIVARTGVTTLPGASGPLTGIQYGTLHAGRVLYRADSPDLGSVLVLHDLASGADRVLCHSGVPIPGRPGETFQSFGSTNWVHADRVVFRAASTADPDNSDVGSTSGLYGWFDVRDWSEGSADLAPEKLRTLVDATSPVPIADLSPGATFDTYGSAPADGGHVVFWALGSEFNGIFAAGVPVGSTRCLVSDHTQIGEPFEGKFTNFGHYPSVSGPNVVFTADATAADDPSRKYRAVFLYRLDRNELYALTDNRAPVAGKEVVGYEIGGHVLAGDRFAVAVVFSDGTSQVCLGTLRPEARRRLGLDAAP